MDGETFGHHRPGLEALLFDLLKSKEIIPMTISELGRNFSSGDVIQPLNCTWASTERELNEVRRRFGMLFQGAALFDSMTVGENVAFPLREHTGMPEADLKKIVTEKLRLVGLKNVEDMMPADLSGGMKKRVGLARAIAMDPEIVLFDEPTTGLDPVMSDNVATLILDTQRNLKTTYIVITHDIPLTYKIADKIAMLHEGKIVEQGDVDYMKTSPNPILRQFLEGRAEGPIKVF